MELILSAPYETKVTFTSGLVALFHYYFGCCVILCKMNPKELIQRPRRTDTSGHVPDQLQKQPHLYSRAAAIRADGEQQLAGHFRLCSLLSSCVSAQPSV